MPTRTVGVSFAIPWSIHPASALPLHLRRNVRGLMAGPRSSAGTSTRRRAAIAKSAGTSTRAVISKALIQATNAPRVVAMALPQ